MSWQFPPDTGEWDDCWLVIDGHIHPGDRAWSFRDPCLLMAEARDLAGWLRAPGGELSFMEPALGFSVAGRDADGLVVRVYLAPRAMPPRAVDLPVSGAQLIAAADEWTRELDALPPRPWVETH